MKGKLIDSIRMKLVLAMLLSLLATLVTDVVVVGSIYMMKCAVSEQTDTGGGHTKNYVDTALQNNNTQAAAQSEHKTSDDTTFTEASESETENEYEPNEYVSEQDRTYKVTLRIRHQGILTPSIWLDVLILAVFSCILFVVYYMLFTNNIIMYFREINLAICQIKNGDLETTVNVRGGNELSEIAASINTMKYELKKSMESERQTERIKNELVTNVAHDLRTPLTSVIGYLDLIHNGECIDDEMRRKYTEIAYEKAKMMEALINDLFDYTRLQKGKIALDLTTFDITTFLAQLLDEFEPQMKKEHLTCVTDIPEKPVMIYADGEKLARAFSNLLANAVKYGADGKQIKVTLIELEEQVYVVITNYGKVIPKEDLPYIFDKFYRVEQSRSTRTGGTGLGLAIAKNIVLMHQGWISAKSDENGTVFTVALPKKVRLEE